MNISFARSMCSKCSISAVCLSVGLSEIRKQIWYCNGCGRSFYPMVGSVELECDKARDLPGYAYTKEECRICWGDGNEDG